MCVYDVDELDPSLLLITPESARRAGAARGGATVETRRPRAFPWGQELNESGKGRLLSCETDSPGNSAFNKGATS